jgi:hypothetical protein
MKYKYVLYEQMQIWFVLMCINIDMNDNINHNKEIIYSSAINFASTINTHNIYFVSLSSSYTYKIFPKDYSAF